MLRIITPTHAYRVLKMKIREQIPGGREGNNSIGEQSQNIITE